MPEIHLSYNPYLLETELKIDGELISSGPLFDLTYREYFGNWVQKILPELSERLGRKTFSVLFNGIIEDFEDIEAEARMYNNSAGTNITIQYIGSGNNDPLVKMETLKSLMDEAKKGPIPELREQNLYDAFESALLPSFEIGVLATMSSGKSTLINAIIGQNLLPAANDATTAIITRVTNDHTVEEFYGNRFYHNGEPELSDEIRVNLDLITKWNTIETKCVELRGPMPMISSDKLQLILVDTPGPNVKESGHHEATYGLLKSKIQPLVIYIIDRTNPKTNDATRLLSDIAHEMSKGGKRSRDRFLFVANKVDALDPERGEDLRAIMEKDARYLSDFGIVNPKIFPVSSLLAKGIRCKSNGVHLSTKELRELPALKTAFIEDPERKMLQYVDVSQAVRKKISIQLTNAESRNDTDSISVINSGIPILEAVIEEYLNKYGVTEKVRHAADTLNRAVAAKASVDTLEASLAEDDEKRKRMHQDLSKIEDRINAGESSKLFQSRLRSMNFELGAEKSDALQQTRDGFYDQSGNAYRNAPKGNVPLQEGQEWISSLRSEADAACAKLRAELQSFYAGALESELKKIRNEYEAHCENVFGEVKELSGIMDKSMLEFDLSVPELLLADEYYKKVREVKTGSYWVSTSKWWNPFSWGSGYNQDIKEKREFILMDNVLEDFISHSRAFYDKSQNKMMAELKMHVELIGQRVADKIDDFDNKIHSLVVELREETKSKETLEARLAEKRDAYKWLVNFNSKLEACLSI